MKLKLERIYTNDKYTIGKLYIDGTYFSDTIEDTDRGLSDDMMLEDVKKNKIYGKTAIPIGTYNVTMNVKSPKFSNFTKYKWSKPYNGFIPRILNVKGFDGILIHVANKAEDILGCIGVGNNNIKGMVTNSTATFHKLMAILREATDNITIEITRTYTKKAKI